MRDMKDHDKFASGRCFEENPFTPIGRTKKKAEDGKSYGHNLHVAHFSTQGLSLDRSQKHLECTVACISPTLQLLDGQDAVGVKS